MHLYFLSPVCERENETKGHCIQRQFNKYFCNLSSQLRVPGVIIPANDLYLSFNDITRLRSQHITFASIAISACAVRLCISTHCEISRRRVDRPNFAIWEPIKVSKTFLPTDEKPTAVKPD